MVAKAKESSAKTQELCKPSLVSIDLSSIPTPAPCVKPQSECKPEIALENIPLPNLVPAVSDPSSIPLPQQLPYLNESGKKMDSKEASAVMLDLKAIPVPSSSGDTSGKEQQPDTTKEGSKNKPEEGRRHSWLL